MNSLIERGLIESKSRLDAPGRPMLFATTDEFLRQFRVDSLDHLPVPDPERLAEIQEEGKEETGFYDEESSESGNEVENSTKNRKKDQELVPLDV